MVWQGTMLMLLPQVDSCSPMLMPLGRATTIHLCNNGFGGIVQLNGNAMQLWKKVSSAKGVVTACAIANYIKSN